MTTINRPVVQGGRVVMGRGYETGGNNPTNKDTAENKADLTANRSDVAEARKELAVTTVDTTKEVNVAQLDLTNGNRDIQELALPQMNAALGLSATSVGDAQDKGAGDPAITQQLFSQLFAGGAKGDDLMKNFAGLTAAVTGESLGRVTGIMNNAQKAFAGGQLNLGNAATAIGEALGLNAEAMEAIAAGYLLLSNPFTAGGAAALFQKAMGLISKSKEKNGQANSQKTMAQQQQQTGQQLAKVAQDRMKQTAAMQSEIKKAMEILKNNQVLTKEQIAKLIKMKQQMNNQPKVDQNQKLMQQNGQIALQPQNPELGKYATAPALTTNQPNGNGLTIPFEIGGCFGKPETINMTMPSVVQQTTPTVGFSPPPFQSITA